MSGSLYFIDTNIADYQTLIERLSSSGTLVDNGNGTWSLTPAANANGEILLVYGVSDGTVSVLTKTTQSVTAVNDAPTSANATVTIDEDTSKIFALTDFAFNDQDTGDTLQSVKITQLPAKGTFTYDGTSVSLNQEISAADIALGKLVFTPDANAYGNIYATFKFQVSDGTAYSAMAYTETINVTSIRDDLIINGTPGDDTLRGDAIDVGSYDTLSGLGGNDILDGKLGADTMSGGTGNDTYYVDNLGDVVIENVDEGRDRVISTISYALRQNVENLSLFGAYNLTGTGNELNNALAGNRGNNILNGGNGNDTLNGGNGNDTLIGGNGNDTLIGGNGIDAASYWSAFRAVTVDLSVSGAQNTLGAGTDTLSSIENLYGSAYNDSLSGDSGNNTLKGNIGEDTLSGGAGNDILDGGLGNDIMLGGAGNDTYYVDNTADKVYETTVIGGTVNSGGIDKIISTVTYTLSSYIENLTLEGTDAINGLGNGQNNLLVGNNANNVLTGLSGNDTINALAGNDVLNGGAGDDKLLGGLGYDTLSGGAGNDTLTGGGGRDFFIFNTALDASTNVDTITDFNVIDDTIRLENAIFTQLSATGVLNADYFKDLSSGVQDSNDYIVYNSNTGVLSYDADGSGSGAAIQIALIGTTTHAHLTNADFVVI